MTQVAYTHFLQGYFEKDQLLFSLTLALEVSQQITLTLFRLTYFISFAAPSSKIESSRGRATRNERDFLISPCPGQQFAIKGLAAAPPVGDTGGAAILSFGKKPFDWLTDAQWQMLLVNEPL